MNIPRNYAGNIVYDLISSDSIVITSKDNLSSINFDKGIFVNNAEKDNNVPSFQSYNGILYYDNNGTLTSTNKLGTNQIINTDNNGNLSMTNLSANNIIYTDNNSSISQLTFGPNQIISTDGSGNLQGYTLKPNNIININNLGYIDQTSLSANSIIYIDNNYNIEFSQINNGILNTYSFDNNNTVKYLKQPHFTEKIVLNNCEILSNNERIQDNYLIYGKPYNTDGGCLSSIIIPKVASSYDYYYIVNAGENNINISSASEIYTDLYDKEYNNNKNNTTNPILFNAIPICTSNDNKNMNLNVLVPNAYEQGNYYINSDGDNFSLKLFDNGSILPSQLATQNNTTFDYKTQNILTAGENVQRNDASQVFNYITSSTKDYYFPYLSGSGWADLKLVNFLNSNNCSVTTNMNYAGPLVVGTSGLINKVTLPANNKYILTNSCFSQLSVDGSDLQIGETEKINLNNIIQISDDDIIRRYNNNNISAGILHTDNQGNITFTQLDSGDIPDNSIKNEKIYNNTITAAKIANNTITAANIYKNTITSDKIALNSITGDNIAGKTITGDNIADKTITSNKIALNSITGNNIAGKTITADNIVDKTITSNKIALNSITGNNIANNTITAVNIYDNTITSNKIALNSITGDNIAGETITGDNIDVSTITGTKLYFADSLESTVWNNIIIDSNTNLITKRNSVLTTSNKYGVFDYYGNIVSLSANLITEGTMDGNIISQRTLQFNRLKTNSNRSSNFKMILVNSSNSFFSTVSSITNGNYGVLDYQGNIVTLNAGKITSGTFGSNRITDNAITSNHLSASSVTGVKLSLSTQLTNSNWSNIIIDSNTNLIKNKNTVLTTNTKYGVFDYYGNIVSLSANLITEGTFGSARIPGLSASKIIAGEFDDARIPSLDASKITTGQFDIDRIPDLDAKKITTGEFEVARIPGLDASKITTGTFGNDRISNLDASKITSGTFNKDRIPGLSASKIIAGEFDTARIPSLDAGKITSGTFGGARIASGAISGDKLNITEGNPNANFKVLVSDSNKNLKLSTSSLLNNQYGIFDYQGSLVQLNSQVLNDIGFKIFLDDDNVNDNSLISVNYVFYVDSIKTKSLQVSYINIGNYYNIEENLFLCKYNNPNIKNINNSDINEVFNDIYSNISNTYTALKNICVSNKIGESSGYNIKLKSSIFIDSVEITNLNEVRDDLITTGFFNDKTLVFGIYTSLLYNNQYSQVIYANDSLYEYKSKNDDFMYYTLLGYFNLDLSTQTITNNTTSLSISINRQYDFECTLPYHKDILVSNFNNISNDLLSIVPLYYVNSDNNISGLNYYKNIMSSYSEIYENISFNNNELVLTGKDNRGTVGTVRITDYNINNNDITFTKPNNITYDRGMLSISSGNTTLVITSTINSYISYNSNDNTITLENYLYEPFEKNIKFNISPITKYSNIKFTKSSDDYDRTGKLTNNITYKISLCNIIASIITVPGEYPSIIQ